MKRLIILLFAIAPLMSYAQQDSEWVQKAKFAILKQSGPCLDGHFFMPTENLLYAHESGIQDTPAFLDTNAHLLSDSSSYQLPASRNAVLFGTFAASAKPNGKFDKDCPELQFKFKNKICNAYRTITEQDFTDDLKLAVQTAKFLEKVEVIYTQTKITLFRGGEYELISDNNAGNGHTAKLTVLSDPICTVDALENEESSCTMHQACIFSVKIGSGYPYAERLANYQNGEMVVSVTDAQNELVFTDTFKLDASADSIKMEFFTGKDEKLYLTSPKYTCRLSGPLLKEDLVVVKEVAANFDALKNAINDAHVLADSISNNAQYASLAEYAKKLTDAIKDAEPCLKLSVYDQDKIDKAANTLAMLIDDTTEAMNKITSVETVTIDGTNTAAKRIIDGKVLITTNGQTYDIKGIKMEK